MACSKTKCEGGANVLAAAHILFGSCTFQVNPHVVPFLKLFQRGEWLGKVSAPLLSELHHVAVQVHIAFDTRAC